MDTTTLPDRLGISTITFRFRPLDEALRLISALGVNKIDLGAIPDVTNHVPVPYTGDPADYVAALAAKGLQAGAVNSDVGDLNDPDLTPDRLGAVALPLVRLAAAVGGALIVPCGRNRWEPLVDEAADLACIARNLKLLATWCSQAGVRLLVEVLHHRRWIHTVERADRLLDLVGPDVCGLLFDIAHVVASAEDPVEWARRCVGRTERVHLRDAVPGNLNLGIGRGAADFRGTICTLERGGFRGDYILELETHDITEAEREADAARSVAVIGGLLREVGR